MELIHLEEIEGAKAENALISDFWLPETEIAGGRDKAGSAEGFFFAAKGGHNAESHNQNDLGSCVLYFNGKPALIDIGRETYTAKTFSGRRYEIWTMQSQYHNIPKINGVDQMQGRDYVAENTSFMADSKKAVFSTDISRAYPEAAAVNKWVRSYQLNRGKNFIVRDDYILQKVMNDPTTLNFIAYCKVSEVKPGILLLQGNGFLLEMKYNAKNLTPTIEFNEVTDAGLQRYWPDGITRIVFTINNLKTKGQNEINITPVK